MAAVKMRISYPHVRKTPGVCGGKACQGALHGPRHTSTAVPARTAPRRSEERTS
jgi:hypothetical protein